MPRSPTPSASSLLLSFVLQALYDRADCTDAADQTQGRLASRSRSEGKPQLEVRGVDWARLAASNRVEVRDVPETLNIVRPLISSIASAERALCLLREAFQGISGSSLPGIDQDQIPLGPSKAQPEILTDGFVDLPPRSHHRILPQTRQPGWCRDMVAGSRCHTAYQNVIRKVLFRPHAVRFITKGGIIWRLCITESKYATEGHHGSVHVCHSTQNGACDTLPVFAMGDEMTGNEDMFPDLETKSKGNEGELNALVLNLISTGQERRIADDTLGLITVKTLRRLPDENVAAS
ncbi:hypothetical protein BV25DRAFT_1843548 [Artomyces pyxidatus]|uniref:Uncharacterized protein n=1 Tax=Artomyces pyxidatus TaxID=48021 RepID=A0ACB8SDH9_9AGAM|nr:hypothetical protein BV25DRAFT_1843548 [Artomyces pyxidatus]